MKKFFSSVALMALIAGAPVTMTSCDEDDVKTVLDIISLFTGNQLQGTAWIASDNSMAIEFLDGTNGNLYDSSHVDKDGNAIAQPFTYTLDTQNNVLTLTLSSGTRRYTVTEFTQGSKLTLTYGGTTYRLTPYNG